MTPWFVFGLMTVVAIFAVLWPLSRASSRRPGSEVAVYRDQLAELTRDRDSGLIGAAEADAARVEISRRLLAADATEQGAAPVVRLGARRSVAVVALIGVPLLAVVLYARYGSPALSDQPLASRSVAAGRSAPLEALVAQVEAHLEQTPNDGRGWEVLAPVLARIGRLDDAVRAYRNALKFNPETAQRHADLGEALAGAANGVITAEAKTEFERATALDAQDVKARYFLGLAAKQDGAPERAASIWREMLASAPANAPWRPLVASALAEVDPTANAPTLPPLSDDAVAGARDMTSDQQSVMIRGMVDGLAARLKQDGNDVEGWLRLVRAYMVLGERDKAQAALAEARQAVAGNADRQRELNEGLKNFGLDG